MKREDNRMKKNKKKVEGRNFEDRYEWSVGFLKEFKMLFHLKGKYRKERECRKVKKSKIWKSKWRRQE